MKLATMPTSGPRSATRARAEQAWRLRVRGRTWQEVADETGFRSRQSAIKAVQKFLERTPPTDVEVLRRAMGDGIEQLRGELFESLEESREAGHHIRVAQLGQVILDSYEKQAKLYGLHVAVPSEVNVRVQSMTEMLTATTARLLEAVDAEVVELPAEPMRAVES